MNSKSETYCIYYREIIGQNLFEKIECLSDFVKIKNPLFRWCADPFVLNINGKEYIFAEISSFLTRKGKIGYVCLNEKKKRWRYCFKPKFHVSFPNVFLSDNRVYVMPETFEDGCLALYQLNDSLKFIKKEVLFNSSFTVDSIIFDKYLITYDSVSEHAVKSICVREFKKPNSILHKVVDYKNVFRPAGNIFKNGDSFVFPTQNCSERYGGGIIFNKLYLDNEQFSFETLHSITKYDVKKYLNIKNCVGCHTYNFDNTYEVIDVIYDRFSILGFFQKVSRKIHHLLCK